MEMIIKLTAQDMQNEGVFDALKQLCLCFKDQAEDRHIKITPPASPAPAPKKDKPATPAPKPAAEAAEPAAITSAPQKRAADSLRPSGTSLKEGGVSSASKKYTLDEVRTSLREYSRTHGAAEAKSIVQSFGVEKATDIPADRYGEVMTALGAVK